MRLIMLIALMIVITAPFYANADEGVDLFKSGIDAFKNKDCTGAISNLSMAEKAIPIIGDYALLFISKSNFQCGEPRKAASDIDTLLRTYPDTPIKKKARNQQIKASFAYSPQKAVELLVSYSRDYPNDIEMQYLLATEYKKQGKSEISNQIFKALYINANEYSEKAHKEYPEIKLTFEEAIRRIDNLIRLRRLKEAESEARGLIDTSHQGQKAQAYEKLGLALFLQKRYKDAASCYGKSGNLYAEAKSCLRAGNLEHFETTTYKLASLGKPEASELLASDAMEYFDRGMPDRAIAILNESIGMFPDDSETARWLLAWHLYKNKNYASARDAFSSLYERYGSSKYQFWLAKSIEKSGEDATQAYNSVKSNDFYGFIARSKSGAVPVSFNTDEAVCRNLPFDRQDALVKVGLIEDAVNEFDLIAKNSSSYEQSVAIACKLTSLGLYRKAISIAEKLPAEQRPHSVLYPLAFGDEVFKASNAKDIDPYLVLSVMREESRFDAQALSPAGAVGLMQLMPKTAQRFNIRESSLTAPEVNISLGVNYLAELVSNFKSISQALSAYNAGEIKATEWSKRHEYESIEEYIEDIPYTETRNYVKRILTSYGNYIYSARASAQSGMLKNHCLICYFN